MRLALVELRHYGVRLTKDQIALARPLIGELLIDDWREGSAEGRALRQAKLCERYASIDRSLLRPLFDPYVLRMTEKWFVLRGYQISSEMIDGAARCTHFAQEWLLRFVTPDIEATANPLNQPG